MRSLNAKGICVLPSSKNGGTSHVNNSGLFRDRLFKTLSLSLAFDAGVQTPATLLVREWSGEISRPDFNWNLPLMLRMDYAHFPISKPLGGIPLHSTEIVESTASTLLQAEIFPLYHPHIDRFKDIYSVGVVLGRETSEVTIEIVGEGFDAGDLRLGASNPHETLLYDLTGDSVVQRKVMNKTDYTAEREQRARRSASLRLYIDSVNKTGALESTLEAFTPPATMITQEKDRIPKMYTPLSKTGIKSLAQLTAKVQDHVLPFLPPSDIYVASVSMIPSLGWMLWDVYGHWYNR